MDLTIDQQVALDEALVPHAGQLRIGKSNFHVPEIYMQEFWATATIHHHSICFKMNKKKCIVNLEYFKEILHICPRIPNQTFYELPFEKEILSFMRNLGHSREIKKIIDVNINILHQPWRSFAAVINKCLSGKSIAYNEYYAIASGATPPKTKASIRKMQSSFDTTMPPPTTVGTRLSTSAKGKQNAKSSKEKGTGIIPGVLDVPTYESDEEISWKSSDEDDDDDVDDQSDTDDDDDNDQEDDDEQDDDDQDDNDDDQDSDNDDDDFVHPKLSTNDEEAKDEESFDPIVQTPSHVENSDDEGNNNASHGMNVGGDEGPDAEDDDDELYGDLNINMEGIDSLFESTLRVDVLVTTTVEPLPLTAPTLPSPSILIISQFPKAFSSIPDIVDRYIDHRINEAVKVAVQLQSNRLRNEAQADNEDFLDKLDENIQKIIKEQVKEQVKVQVSKILPKIEKTVNEAKKIIIEKMESNKSIHRSDEQRNLYKALVDAYECDKIILDTYGDTVKLKRRRNDEDKDEEPSAGSDRRSKRRRAGKEPESTSAPKEKASKTSGKSTKGSKSYQKTVNTLTPELLAGPTYDLMKGSCKSLVELEFFLEEVYKGISHWGRKRKQFYGFTVNRESARDVYSKRRIMAVIELQIVKWHNYKHLDWITETDQSHCRRTLCFQRLFKDVHEKHRHPTACGRSSISDGTLNDVRTALDDRLKGIRMKYLPQTIWRRSDKERAAVMIHAIDKQ
nr:hypothetical protein [Tanacetum cinerariifolium]